MRLMAGRFVCFQVIRPAARFSSSRFLFIQPLKVMLQTTILIIDDDPKIRKLLRINLRSLGYEVLTAPDASHGLRAIEDFSPNLVLLDVMMPGVDGFTTLAQIRTKSDIPVIMLTARDQIEDKVKGFELGADDYLPKPFALEELFGRVKAVLRRAKPSTDIGVNKLSQLVNGTLVLDQADLTAMVGSHPIHLTGTEFKVLATLMRHKDKVLSHEYLLRTVWGPEYVGETHYVRVVIARLRQKLKEVEFNAELIRAVSGIGYVMETEEAKGETLS